ncbi:response regulator transcription factor [Sphingosinicella rhizophila]|uniref:Helix-turn-helix domain-containing protein n=1 Tax=Sphingosinicella rhizophila TaxID=3050082 RepID=A0ABU3QA07_9SPHN|nr:helix-turn-helix domain-containing protein [Sphingosinicella sp. GR2756]MDT9600246.1 helix-turn-helix domain-containing protein [Sphingosinicella sp. GR2756]
MDIHRWNGPPCPGISTGRAGELFLPSGLPSGTRETSMLDQPILSARERECLEGIARGKRVQAIASALLIAPVTVELHLKNVRAKLGASTTAEAVAIAIRKGAISPYG